MSYTWSGPVNSPLAGIIKVTMPYTSQGPTTQGQTGMP
jgi:hypothetical protein